MAVPIIYLMGRKTAILTTLSLFFILLLSMASCTRRADWIMFRGEQGRGTTDCNIQPPIGVKWKLKLQFEEKSAPAFNPPIVKGKTIYFGSPDGNFYALDIESGYMRWVFKTGGVINSVPFADEENVYFGSNDGKVYAVSLKDGHEVWSFQTESTVQSTVVRNNDSVVFTSDGGSMYFLSPEGALQYRIPNPVWHYDTFQVHENVVYFAPGPLTRPHSLGAFDLKQKFYLWILNTAALRATWYSFPAIKGKYLHFATCASYDNYWNLNYYCFDRKSGDLIWRYTDESYFSRGVSLSPNSLFTKNLKLLDYMSPSIWKNLVLYTSGDSTVRAFNARRGKIAWRHVFDQATSSAPTVAGNRIYFGLHGESSRGGRQPKIVCLSARNGKKLWELELEGAILSAPVIAGKWIIFGTDKNLFYVLEELY